MTLSPFRAIMLGAISVGLGCGDTTQVEVAPPLQNLQHLPFSGVVDPASGRFQLVAGPQASLVTITRDRNGDPNTVAPNTLQVYAASVSFASGNVGYPAGCNPAAPQVMYASVEAFSGFAEQLRNVYARITSVSGGETFCTRDSPGAFAALLGASPPGLYLYPPLDRGARAGNAIRRPVQWALNLPDNGAFWFDGDFWAEIVPQPPTITKPADGAAFNSSNPTAEAAFAWTEDLTANGSTPAGSTVPVPTRAGAQLTITRCNTTASGAYDPAACTTVVSGPTVTTALAFAIPLPVGSWYQWSIRSVFTLPGDAAPTIGSLVTTRHFKTVTP
jgi:hypothetical protein